jgi:thiamine-phosphate pyrophosphorylase
MARKFGALFAINDRVDVAMAMGADGIHVGPEDLPAREARKLLPPPVVLGVSAGTREEARKAERDGADYIGVGPVFATGTKPDAGAPIGIEGFAAIARAVSIPVVAIGGITIDNVAAVIGAGAAGVAVVASVVGAEDITAAARALKRRIVELRRAPATAGPAPAGRAR